MFEKCSEITNVHTCGHIIPSVRTSIQMQDAFLNGLLCLTVADGFQFEYPIIVSDIIKSSVQTIQHVRDLNFENYLHEAEAHTSTTRTFSEPMTELILVNPTMSEK